ELMFQASSIGALALIFVLCMPGAPARAFDDAQYPDFAGKWDRAPTPNAPRTPQPAFDPSKGWGRGQQAPLTAEYGKILDASLADQAVGGSGNHRGYTCVTLGMPGIMTLFQPMEVIILPETTYIRINRSNISRRVFTDGRDWPKDIDPALVGYSIGRWLDESGSGPYDWLEGEPRAFAGPRTADASGLPFHRDNQSIVKERFWLDKADKNLMHNDITVMDHALTRPWTVHKIYRRDASPQPVWAEEDCAEGNPWVGIGGQGYMLSAEGEPMPAKPGQPSPVLRS